MSRVAVITGTSSGLGYSLALLLAKRGFITYATMRNTAKGETLLAAAKEAGGDVRIAQLDVQDQASIDRCVEQVLSEAGQVDVWVNNAGAGFLRTTKQATE